MRDDQAVAFADLLKQYRSRARLSQEELAERAGLSVRAISDLERGHNLRPRIATVRLLVAALSLSKPEQAAFEAAAHGESSLAETGPARAHNLPSQITSFVGRTHELQAVVELVLRLDVRLLTLTGPGGAGKTRLAVRVAEDVLPRFVDGVRFVDLAPVSAPALVSLAIARALHVTEGGSPSLLDAVVAHLRDRSMLLVLDNVEQVVVAAPVATQLLAACPGLTVLVTSRVLLRVSGEHVYAVPPLTLPQPGSQLLVADMARFEAVHLFVTRTQAVEPGFALTHENAPAVIEICQRLDGLPLAIELVAPWVKVLRPSALLARLDRVLPLLRGGARDLPERQRTMEATLRWSYDLLRPGDQALLARLAVFTGGCSLEAADVVCRLDRWGEHTLLEGDEDLLDGIASLVDHSLLRQEMRLDGESAFFMPKMVGEYALARLAESGEAEEIRERHAAYYLKLVEAGEQELKGPQQAEWLHRLEAERDNLRAAVLWAHASGNVEVGLRLAGALQWFWLMRGYLTEARSLLESVLAAPGGTPAARAKALTAHALLTWRQGDYQRTIALLEEALALYQELGDMTGAAFALHHTAHVYEAQGHYAQAVALFEESLARFRDSSDRWGLALTLNCLAEAFQQQGQYDRATPLLREGVAWTRQVGDQHTRADLLRLMGLEQLRQGNHEQARMLIEEGLTQSIALKDKQSIALLLHILAVAALGVGDDERAHALLLESLQLQHELGQKLNSAKCLGTLAAVAGRQGRYERAARLLGAVAALLEWLAAPFPPADQAAYERTVAAARAHLGEEGFQMAWEAGETMPLEQTIAYALDTMESC